MNLNVLDDPLVIHDKIYFSVFEKGKGIDFKVAYYQGNVFDDELFCDLDIVTDYDNNVGFEIRAGKDPNSNQLCVLQEDDERGEIKVLIYDEDGSLADTVDMSNEKLEGCVNSFKIRKDGKLFLAAGNGIYAYSDENGMIEYFHPDNALLQSIFLKNEEIAGVFRMTKDDGTPYQSIMLFDDQGNIESTMEVPLYSSAFVTYGDEIYYYYDRCIYAIGSTLDQCELVMKLCDKEDQFFTTIYAIIKKDSEYGVVYKSLSDEVIRSVLFHKTQESKQDKKEITVYDPTGMMDMYVTDQMIHAFNDMNQDYYVTKKEYERDFNYVLLSDDKPDLIFLNELGVGGFGHLGYLEDLTPYFMEQSSQDGSGLIKNLTDKLQVDGKLYSLPRTIGLEAFCGYASKVGTEIGWSENEFVEWFLDHPEALKESWMGHLEILRFSLEGSLDKYVDFNNKESKLKEGDFRKLLQTIKQITTFPREEIMKSSAGDVMNLSFETADDLAYWNKGEPLTLKGFPDKNASANYILTYFGLAMMNTSNNKEGAFEFIKFIQEYRYGFSCYFYTLDATLEKMFAIRIRENMGKPEYEKVQQDFWQLYSSAHLRDLNSVPVISIILEEAGAYFDGDKTVEEVTDVIHGRVQLWLDERK